MDEQLETNAIPVIIDFAVKNTKRINSVAYAIKEKTKNLTEGHDGKSAYEMAQEHGYTGTEEQFSTHLSDIGRIARETFTFYPNSEDPSTTITKDFIIIGPTKPEDTFPTKPSTNNTSGNEPSGEESGSGTEGNDENWATDKEVDDALDDIFG